MPYTLLLADDSATIQRVIELTFADEDVTVIAVSDGDQAIARLDASPPDIVLADIGMPGRNGYDVARYISRSPKLSHIPVVLLTGAFEPVDQTRADEAGCDGVLAKPFEPQMVIGRVKELLARSRAAAPADELTWAPPFSERRAVPFDLDWLGAKAGAAGSAEAEAWDDLPAAAREGQPVADLPLSHEPSAHEPSFDVPDGIAPDAPPEEAAAVPAPPVETHDDHLAPVESPEEHLASIETPEERLAPIEASMPIETDIAPSVAAETAPELEPLPGPPPLPALADAFAALLAAEQDEPLPASGTWPGMPSSTGVSEALVDEVVRRVLARLPDAVVREAVADIASKVAERLIREEIERIKASIK